MDGFSWAQNTNIVLIPHFLPLRNFSIPIYSPGPCGLSEAFHARRLAGPGHPGAVGPCAADHRGAGGGPRGAAVLRTAAAESIREPRRDPDGGSGNVTGALTMKSWVF